MKAKKSHTLISLPKLLITLLPYVLVLVSQSKWAVEAQIPSAKLDGFVYGDPSKFNPGRILIEAFFDPVCPYSRDAWPPLKKALHHYASLVSLILHPFPLPYHDNAFVSSRAIHIVNELNSSATYPMWEKFFKHQEKFYSKETINKSKSEIVHDISHFVTELVGDCYYSTIQSGFNDTKTDLKTRVSFKYGCSRGVFGTPTFFVNGFALPDASSPTDYQGWRKVIDPLLGSKSKAIHLL